MKIIYCIKCSKQRKLQNLKISQIFDKALFLSIICALCDSKDEKLFKEAESIQISKCLGLIKYRGLQNKYLIILKINMTDENIILTFRQKNIGETNNYIFDEINKTELMSKKHKQVCTTLSCIKYLFILGSMVTLYVQALQLCISVSDFASLVGIPIGITSTAIGIKI